MHFQIATGIQETRLSFANTHKALVMNSQFTSCITGNDGRKKLEPRTTAPKRVRTILSHRRPVSSPPLVRSCQGNASCRRIGGEYLRSDFGGSDSVYSFYAFQWCADLTKRYCDKLQNPKATGFGFVDRHSHPCYENNFTLWIVRFHPTPNWISRSRVLLKSLFSTTLFFYLNFYFCASLS